MEQAYTLDATFGGRISGDNRAQLVVDGLQSDFSGIWISLRNLLVAKWAPARPEAGSAVEPLSGYYAGAYERASAATPITSSRQLL